MIDGDGRVFGRVNIIDACAVALIIAIVPASLIALRTFRTRPLYVTSVRPHTLTIGAPMRVQVEGTAFRPYLEAYVGRTGQPFVLEEADRRTQKATYLLASPSLVQLEFPELAAGTYDLLIAEHGRVIASSPAALTVSQPERAAGARTVKVQFYPPPDAVSLIRVGDRDIVEPRMATSPGSEPATVVAVDARTERREVIDMHLTPKADTWFGQPMIGQLVEVTLRVPQSETGPNAWMYNESGVRVGGLFTLTTDRYRLRGVVTWMGDVQRIASTASTP